MRSIITLLATFVQVALILDFFGMSKPNVGVTRSSLRTRKQVNYRALHEGRMSHGNSTPKSDVSVTFPSVSKSVATKRLSQKSRLDSLDKTSDLSLLNNSIQDLEEQIQRNRSLCALCIPGVFVALKLNMLLLTIIFCSR